MLDSTSQPPMGSEVTLGAYLRRSRTSSGLSLEAVSTGSRIVPRLLEALEEDRHEALPAPVFVRGFIRAYCGELGIAPEEALALYEQQVPAARRPYPAGPPPEHRPAPAPARRVRPPRRLALAGVVALAALGLAAALLIVRARRSEPVAGHAAAASAGPVASAGAWPDTAPAAGPGAGRPERVLVVRALDTTWLRVQPDRARAEEETLAAGAVREWRSPGRFRLTVGNAGGVRVELDGRPLPALGAPGQVVRDVVLPDDGRP